MKSYLWNKGNRRVSWYNNIHPSLFEAPFWRVFILQHSWKGIEHILMIRMWHLAPVCWIHHTHAMNTDPKCFSAVPILNIIHGEYCNSDILWFSAIVEKFVRYYTKVRYFTYVKCLSFHKSLHSFWKNCI